MVLGIPDEVLNRRNALGLGNTHGVGWNDGGGGENGVAEISRNGILDQKFLQLKFVLGEKQILVGGSFLTLGTHDLHGSDGTDLHLLTIVGESFFRQFQGALFHFDIFISIDQIPIDVLNLRNRSDDLAAEGDIGDFAVIVGDADEPHIGGKTEPGQEVLAQGKTKSAIDFRRQDAESAIGGDAVVIEVETQQSAGAKSL